MRLRASTLGICGLALIVADRAQAADVDFTRDVRSILSQYCLKCHGPDDASRKAGLRLDRRESALAPLNSGSRAIVPTNPDESELVARIESTEEGYAMPPPSANLKLSREQVATLKKWVAEGAEYREHWAFVPPKQAPLPAVRQSDWPRNPIDYFTLSAMEAAALKPNPEADRYALARRLSLDLIGLPPTLEELDAFINDRSEGAYERLVEQLLKSPHYGERWGRRWLDLARYSDTNGYEKDRPRSIYPYRDWVINALNADMPFDRFTLEQIAGDMLPGATEAQRVATGFHRNTMLNEEGGIDPLEFRYYAVVDRANTTATTWLGLTLQCAQCHTHKYDPIPHQEYFSFLALLNNAEEPELELPDAETLSQQAAAQKTIDAREAALAEKFPPKDEWEWHAPAIVSATTRSGATIERLEDGSLLVAGEIPDDDNYVIECESNVTGVQALRLEVLTHPSLGKNGPGRTPHGNFVLTELSAVATNAQGPQAEPAKIVRAESDVAQNEFPAANAFDGNPKTGWAVDVGGNWNVDRKATFYFEKAQTGQGTTRWKIVLDQSYGGKHTIGRFRLSLARPMPDDRPLEVRRRAHLEERFQAWLADETARAVSWKPLTPTEAKANIPLLTILDDQSILGSGDISKRDTYQVRLAGAPSVVTAIRIEALPDDRLPGKGPGLTYYEGIPGDFFLSKFELFSVKSEPGFVGDPVLEPYDPLAIPLSEAFESFHSGGDKTSGALDGDDRTGWSIIGGQGKPQSAVFQLKEPLSSNGTLEVRLTFARYFASPLGRFRLSATTDTIPEGYRARPREIEELLLIPTASRTTEQTQKLQQHFLSVVPELAAERQEIQKLRDALPKLRSTLVLQERPAHYPRPTCRHHRGEFLQPREQVEPDSLSFLPPLPANAPRDRLSLGRWLCDPRNPLTPRVTVNRQWAALFGNGIVRTTEDFGYQGAPPTHPELLDWLAVEFMRQGWSLKAMHRLIVTSATYRQSSQVSAEKLARDPQNELLSRAPRLRLEAEIVRDAAWRTSGLLSPIVGGPSVFPPQPAGVSSEGAYGPLAWKVSEGHDRYRRGLYTYSKRTAPYGMFAAFDAPSGEACIARREVSNTPLQALTLLNDIVVIDATQALGRSAVEDSAKIEPWGAKQGLNVPPEELKAAYLVARCLSRPATEVERQELASFFDQMLKRVVAGELDAAAVAGPGTGDAKQRAAWTLVARVLINLDEFVSRR